MITTRQGLIDYAKRVLGSPVINIEIDPTQEADAVESAILMYQEYHPDAVERDLVKHVVTATRLTVLDATGISVGTTISKGDTTAVVSKVDGNVLTIGMQVGMVLFAVNDVINFPAGSTTITVVTLGDKDKKYLDVDDGIFGIIRVLPWTPGFASGIFDITYQLRMNDLRNLSSGTLNYFYTTMGYLADMDFVLRKEKQFRFNRRMNKLYLDIDWQNDVAEGDVIVFEVYRTVNDLTYTEVYNDVWLKKYMVALLKKYWANGIRKYQNMTLPGGLILNGDKFYEEAVEELHELEQDLIQNQSPLSFYVG